jgi:hypothetical protein
MADETFSWDDYYKKIQGRAPRQLLLDALEKFPTDSALHAIDLAVAMTRQLYFCAVGVLAVDGAEAGMGLLDKVPPEAQNLCKPKLQG